MVVSFDMQNVMYVRWRKWGWILVEVNEKSGSGVEVGGGERACEVGSGMEVGGGECACEVSSVLAAALAFFHLHKQQSYIGLHMAFPTGAYQEKPQMKRVGQDLPRWLLLKKCLSYYSDIWAVLELV